MNRRRGVVAAAVAGILGAGLLAASMASAAAGESVLGSPSRGCVLADARLNEVSGIATSMRYPGILWVHNDSGDSAKVFAVEQASCSVKATVTLAGVTAADFEAISMGREADGSPTLWVADVGDNAERRMQVQLYRVDEPALADATVKVSTTSVRYSDGPRNCESLMVDPRPGGPAWLVTKEETGGVYALPADLGCL